MKEVFDSKGDRISMNWTVIIDTSIIGNIGSDSKGYRLGSRLFQLGKGLSFSFPPEDFPVLIQG